MLCVIDQKTAWSVRMLFIELLNTAFENNNRVQRLNMTGFVVGNCCVQDMHSTIRIHDVCNFCLSTQPLFSCVYNMQTKYSHKTLTTLYLLPSYRILLPAISTSNPCSRIHFLSFIVQHQRGDMQNSDLDHFNDTSLQSVVH